MVALDLAKGDGAGAEAVGLIHPTGGGGGLAGSLSGHLLAAYLASGGFLCRLFCPGHDDDCCAAMDDSLDEVRRHAGVASSGGCCCSCVDVVAFLLLTLSLLPSRLAANLSLLQTEG